MNDVLAIGLQSMQLDMARVEQAGMNLANALTPGYRRGVVVQGTMAGTFRGMVDAAAGAANASAATVATDMRPGTLKATGQALDLALSGPGYFEVMTAEGPAYARQGNFRLDERGRLVTAQGFPVMGRNGEIQLANSAPQIDASGAVSASAQPAGTLAFAALRLVKFDDDRQLQKRGDGLFSASGTAIEANDAQTQVRQGYLENSNVSSMQEMVQLVQTMRHFESMHKVAQGYDDMLGTAIRKLGETS